MDNRDVQIVTQTAFKAVMDRLPADADLTDSDTLQTIAAETLGLFGVLADVIAENQKANVAMGQAAAIAAVNQAFPNSEPVNEAPHPAEQGGFALEVANPQDQAGPLPDWLIRKAQELGVTKVWDNRAAVASDPSKARQPHFREFVPKGVDKRAAGFWPPNSR